MTSDEVFKNNPDATPADYYSAYFGQTSNPTFADFYSWSNGGNPYSLSNKFVNFFTGDIDRAKDSFNEWYNRWSQQEQREFDIEATRSLRSTEYQDVMKSLRDAGINPYGLLTTAGLGSSGGSYSSSDFLTSSSSKENTQRGMAAFIYMIGRIAAAVLTKGKTVNIMK